jgi:hypothetical protein
VAARCDGNIALLVRAVLAGVELRESYEIAVVRERLEDGVVSGHQESRSTNGHGTSVHSGATGTERLHIVVVLLGHNVAHVVVGYLAVVPRDDPRHQVAGGLEERVAVELRIPLALLLDRLKYLPNLAAASVSVPATRVHVKESIEPQFIQLSDNTLYRMGKQLAYQYS